MYDNTRTERKERKSSIHVFTSPYTENKTSSIRAKRYRCSVHPKDYKINFEKHSGNILSQGKSTKTESETNRQDG